MREVRDTRTPVIDYEHTGWSWADPRRQHAYSASFFPLVDDKDRVTGVCYLLMDVTDRWEARQRLALINEASGRIGSTLNIDRTAQELADVAVPRLADFAAVDLLEPVLHGDAERTSTARARLQADGSAEYDFDLSWNPPAADPSSATHVHTGSIALFLEPGGSAVVELLEALPAGVTAIDGGFLRGDPVEIVGPDGAVVAKALAGYDAYEARLIMGHRSDRIAGILGHQGRAALVHRDDLAL